MTARICEDCGRKGGIQFGFCRHCTPLEYYDAQKILVAAVKEADREWKKSPLYVEYQQQIARIKKEQEIARERFVAPLIKDAEQAFQEIKKKHHPKDKGK